MVNAPKNNVKLTKIETVSLLRRLQYQDLKEIAETYDMTVKQVKEIRYHYKAFSADGINQAIEKLENQIGFRSTEGVGRDYQKQEVCKPTKMYFKCYTCQFTASENNTEGIIEHVSKCQERKVVALPLQIIV